MRVLRFVVAVLVAAAILVVMTVAGCSSGDQASTTDDGASSASGAQDGLEVGVKAPDFRLKDQDQTTVVLSDYLGASNVIVVFYPLAFTPV